MFSHRFFSLVDLGFRLTCGIGSNCIVFDSRRHLFYTRPWLKFTCKLASIVAISQWLIGVGRCIQMKVGKESKTVSMMDFSMSYALTVGIGLCNMGTYLMVMRADELATILNWTVNYAKWLQSKE